MNNFPQYNALGDLRILTIIADQPEVNPGTLVNFTPVLSDLNGVGRTLNYSIEACVDPGIRIGVFPACATPDSSSIQSGTVSIAAGTSQTYTGSVSTFSLTMPSASTIFASQNTMNQYNGIDYLVFYTLSVPNTSTSVNSFVRVTVSESSKTTKNQNPSITAINLNDSPITSIFSMPTVAANFSATLSSSSVEVYQKMNADGSFTSQTEELYTTWFISDGTLSVERTLANAENTWSPPSAKPSGRGLVILAVTRDGRNGAAFEKIEMN